MKALRACLSVGLLFASLVGCERHAPSVDGGVGVGNGSNTAVSYYSFAHKFMVRYPSTRIAVLPGATDEKFQFSDQPYLGRPEQASRIEFEVIAQSSSAAVKTEEELEAMVKGTFKTERVTKLMPPKGAKAALVHSPSAPGPRVQQFVWILTDSDDVIVAHIDAHAGGFTAMQEILGTFVHDTTGPVVTAINVPESPATIGAVARIPIEAHDDLSGLGTQARVRLRPAFKAKGERPEEIRRVRSFTAVADLLPIGKRKYELVIPIRSWVQPGTFCVASLTVWDGMRNPTFLDEGPTTEGAACGGLYRNSSIPVRDIVLESMLSSDTEKPILESVTFSSDSASPGASVEVVFKIKENGAGIDSISLGMRPLFALPKGLAVPPYEWVLSPDAVEGQKGIVRLGRRPNGYWSAKLPLSVFRLAGKYRLEGLQVVDRALNRTVLLASSDGTEYHEGAEKYVNSSARPVAPPVFEVSVTPEPPMEGPPPDVAQVTLAMNVPALMNGTSGIWIRTSHLKAEVTAITGRIVSISHGGEPPFEIQFGTGRALSPERLGPDLFLLSLDSPALSPGDYQLEELIVYDAAYRSTRLVKKRVNADQFWKVGKDGDERTRIEAVRFRVDR